MRGHVVISTAAPPVDPPPDDEPSPLVVSVVLDTRSDPRWVSASEDVIPAARPKPPADDAEEEDIVIAKHPREAVNLCNEVDNRVWAMTVCRQSPRLSGLSDHNGVT